MQLSSEVLVLYVLCELDTLLAVIVNETDILCMVCHWSRCLHAVIVNDTAILCMVCHCIGHAAHSDRQWHCYSTGGLRIGADCSKYEAMLLGVLVYGHLIEVNDNAIDMHCIVFLGRAA